MEGLTKKEEDILYLEKVKTILEQRRTSVQQRKAQEKEVELLKDALKKEEKALADQIRKTISKRRSELENEYDKEIRELQNRLDQAKKRRIREKEKAVALRIKEETEGVREEKNRLKGELNAIYKKAHVPILCRTNLYYALHCPGSFGDVLKILLYLFLLYLVLPAGIIFFLTDHSTKFMILIFLADLVLFGSLYLMIHSATRNRYGEALLEGRRIRREIHKNEKEQRRLEKVIHKDPDEESYRLQEYDAQIVKAQEELTEKQNERLEAIRQFEEETETQIREEVSAAYDDRIATLEEDLEEETQGLEESLQDEQYFENKLEEVRGDILPQEFLEDNQIERLMAAMEDGAEDLTQAMAIVQEEQKA